MAKKDPLDVFFDKNFPESATGARVVKPLGGERETTFDQRRQENIARSREHGEADGKEAGEPKGFSVNAVGTEEVGEGSEPVSPQAEESPVSGAKQPGRPKSSNNVVLYNFKIELEAKQKLERLKIDTFRASVSDLLREAIHDLFVKYGVE